MNKLWISLVKILDLDEKDRKTAFFIILMLLVIFIWFFWPSKAGADVNITKDMGAKFIKEKCGGKQDNAVQGWREPSPEESEPEEIMINEPPFDKVTIIENSE